MVKPRSIVLFDVHNLVSRQELGAGDTLKYNVLTDVLDERYDRALRNLEDYLEKPSPYPDLKDKVERLVHYAMDVVHAIRAKRSFSGLAHLTMSKQKEFIDKFRTHVLELKTVLMKIELAEHRVRVADARSTVIFIKTVWICFFFLVVIYFFFFSSQSIAQDFLLISDDLIHKFVNWTLR